MDTTEWMLTIIAYTFIVYTLATTDIRESIIVLPLHFLMIALPIFMIIDVATEITGFGTWKD
ncbi:hypothetical protein AB7C87_23300 [Natrarchaeobius sp. A-rgal3]|uniref:hypothetical protein n=1 Tax=Natrarchaeobius versutus TaxID=1679078 RepID=UPI00350F18E3